jgi:peroxiredoxin
LPSLLSLKERYRDKPFKVLLVSVQEQKETVQRFFAKNQIPLQILLDQDGKISRSYRVSSHPIKFLIDGKGNMIAMGLGYRSWDSEEMLRLVDSLIQQEEEKTLVLRGRE